MIEYKLVNFTWFIGSVCSSGCGRDKKMKQRFTNKQDWSVREAELGKPDSLGSKSTSTTL